MKVTFEKEVAGKLRTKEQPNERATKWMEEKRCQNQRSYANIPRNRWEMGASHIYLSICIMSICLVKSEYQNTVVHCTLTTDISYHRNIFGILFDFHFSLVDITVAPLLCNTRHIQSVNTSSEILCGFKCFFKHISKYGCSVILYRINVNDRENPLHALYLLKSMCT